MKANIRWMTVIVLVSVLFFWKLLFSHQFSVMTFPEIVNQAYSWYHFSAATVKQGALPLWDPFTHAGRTFVGGMETGVFYPLKLVLYLWPFNREGLFSPQVFQDFHVLTHVLAAFFLFLLARELGLGGFPAFVASLCFSFGGYLPKIPWPDMLDSSIWLPLVLLFLTRAWRAAALSRAGLCSCLAGLSLGMSILAGRIHIVMMDVLVVVSAAAYLAWTRRRNTGDQPQHLPAWTRAVLIVAIIGITSGALGAVQILPSVEYSHLAVRYIGADAPVQAREKISYSDLRDELKPQSLLGFLFCMPFPGGSIGGEGFTPYIGVLPLLLTVFAVWLNWGNPWVRYLTVLAVLSFFYTLGPYSLLHGLGYALVPYLWLVRNAGRFIYLTHFAMALLTGYGVQSLFYPGDLGDRAVGSFSRMLVCLMTIVGLAVGVPAVYNKPYVSDWMYFSFLMILAGCGLLIYVARGHSTFWARFLLVGVILCDFYPNYWIIQNRVPLIKSGLDPLQNILDSRNLADFLKRQPGLFRVHLAMEGPPNIGDLYGVQITECMMATELEDFMRFRLAVPRALDYMNVRYIVRRKNAGEPGPVYEDALYKVYENPTPLPRAWIVHKAVEEPSFDRTLKKIVGPDFDPSTMASVSRPLSSELEPEAEASQEEVRVETYLPNRLELVVQAKTRGLLVLSEVDYPGWKADVNGRETPIEKVNGIFRGVVVPGGASKVVFRYAPASVIVGAVLTILAVLTTVILAAALWLMRRRTAQPVPSESAP